jgi:hypothetical protein
MAASLSPTVTRFKRVTSHFDEFRKANGFVDLVLTSGSETYPAHRIYLASSCTWFATELSKPENALPPDFSDPLKLALPFNPEGRFGQFLEFLYTGKAVVPAAHLPELLAISLYYQATAYVEMFRFFLHQQADQPNLLARIAALDRLGIADEAAFSVPHLAEGLAKLLSGAADPPFQLSEVYAAIPPQLLAAILNHKQLAEFRKDSTALISLLDDYYAVCVHAGRVLTQAQREALASTHNWADAEALVVNRSLFAEHACEWLPAELSTELQSAVLKQRRATLANFQKEIGTIGPSVSQWYVAAWVRKLRSAQAARRRPHQDVIEFMSTIGGLVKPIDPHRYGFLKVEGFGNPLGALYSAEKIFEPDRYFLALASPREVPAVAVDFYNTRLGLFTVKWDTSVPKKTRNTPAFKCPDPAPKPTDYRVQITWGSQPGASVVTDATTYEVVNPQNAATSRVTISFPAVTLTKQGQQEKATSPIARLQSVEFDATFEP